MLDVERQAASDPEVAAPSSAAAATPTSPSTTPARAASHVEVLWDGERARVRDLGSTNGTQLNGAHGHARRCSSPTPSITIGRTDIVFRVLAQAAPPDAADARRSDATAASRHRRVLGAGWHERTDPPAAALGFLLLLWVFVFAVVYSLRSDLFGVEGAHGCRSRGRGAAAARPPRPPAPARPRRRHGAPSRSRGARLRGQTGETGDDRDRLAHRHHERAEGRRSSSRSARDADHDRALERLGDRHPRRLHLQPPRAPRAVGRAVDDPGPRLDERHLARRRPRDRAGADPARSDRSRSARRRSSCGSSGRTCAMVFQGSSAAISHTGKVRSNNQDSGYAGSQPVRRRRRHGRPRRR